MRAHRIAAVPGIARCLAACGSLLVTAALIILGAFPGTAAAEINGTLAQFPQAVPIVEGGTSDAYCTGVLVRRDLILTAAHCLYPEPLAWFAHQWNRVYIDPGYCRQTDVACASDIAIIKLAHKVAITPLSMGVPVMGQPAESYGYGLTNWSASSDNRLHANVGIVAASNNIPGTFQTLSPDSELGRGDSGGPLVQNGRVIGLNEATSIDQVNLPSYYSTFDQWTWSTVNALEKASSRRK